MTKVFNINSAAPFLKALAGTLQQRARSNPLALHQMTLFLPTRRACRVLTHELQALSPHSTLLAPFITPITDIPPHIIAPQLQSQIPPLLTAPERRILLLQFLQLEMNLSFSQSSLLVDEIINFLDDLYEEEIDLNTLSHITSEEFALHLQERLYLLTLLQNKWPLFLKKHGVIEPIPHRSLLLRLLAQTWLDAPPQHPIIFAGITGSIPAVADLMASLRSVPSAEIWLKGMDAEMEESLWDNLSPVHPQFVYKKLLEKLSYSRRDIKKITSPFSFSERPKRTDCLRKTFSPLSQFASVQIPEEDRDLFSLIECPSPHQEALTISLIIRESLETPHKNVALVTPDRMLADRVSALLKRWNITADDSAGIPYRHLPIGTYLEMAARFLFMPFDPLHLLSFFKHPFFKQTHSDHFQNAHTFEKTILRSTQNEQNVSLEETLAYFSSPLKETLSHAQKMIFTESTLKDYVKAHLYFAEVILGEKGAQFLWTSEEGRALKILLSGILESRLISFPLTAHNYVNFFKSLLSQETLRKPYGQHPRVLILGPMEARLLHIDRVILGGMNQGVWPSLIREDPWLNHHMRQSLNFPDPLQYQGFAAHDVVNFLHLPEVFITRSVRVNGTSTLPSPWWMRMEAMNKNQLIHKSLSNPWSLFCSILDKPPSPQSLKRPSPCPALHARPQRLSISHYTQLQQDPYAFYASVILKLTPLRPLNQPLTDSTFGIILHRILEEYGHKQGQISQTHLIKRADQYLEKYNHHPMVPFFWRIRMRELIKAFFQHESTLLPLLKGIYSEVKGEMSISTENGPLTLKGKADRINLQSDGQLVIIDYKTGMIPSKTDIQSGYQPQLPLEGAIAQYGRFFKITDPHPVSQLQYWHLKGTNLNIYTLDDTQNLIEMTHQHFQKTMSLYHNPNTPYGAVTRSPYTEYHALSRVQEWSKTLL